MSSNSTNNLVKYSAITSAFTLILILIALIPTTRRSITWNTCVKHTLGWFNRTDSGLSQFDTNTKLSLATAVCNGAVHEPVVKQATVN
tara:strand:+ start:169 stop:432 length:264 start_codon:yes stop_codon:yes gene_type:complete